MLTITEGAPEQARLLIEENLTSSGLCFSVLSQNDDESEEVFLTRDDLYELNDLLVRWYVTTSAQRPKNATFEGSLRQC